jgi:drug/metabolite transporter (DMT)-like permease
MLLLTVPGALALIGAGLLLPHSFPARAWLCVVPSGIICGLYFRFLALAYGSSDFTVVYPVARALPVLMVAGIDVARGHYPTATGWLAMVMVVAGCALAPQRSYRDLDLRHYTGRAILWMLLTAATIAGFSMLDKLAAETVRRGPGSAAIYCGLWHVCACATYLLLGAVFGRGGRTPQAVGWAMPAAAALLGLASYTLVLWAYQLSPHTGYLLALRQFSIVIGVLAAFRLYREEGLAVRLPATAAIVAGLVIVVLRG